MRQTHLTLDVHQRVTLLNVDTVRALLGVDSETVKNRIDDGQLCWVFDISVVDNYRRELRIWARTLEPGGTLALAQVIDEIIGTQRPTLRGAELEVLLLCSRQHIQQLHERGLLRGEVVGHTRHIKRDSLVAFLRRRFIA